MAKGTFIDDYQDLAEHLIECGNISFETTLERLNYGDIILFQSTEKDIPGIQGRLGVFAGRGEGNKISLRTYPSGLRTDESLNFQMATPSGVTPLPYSATQQERTSGYEVEVNVDEHVLILDAKHDPDLAYNTWDLDRVAADLQENLAKDISLVATPDKAEFYGVSNVSLLLVKDLDHGAGLLLVEKKEVKYVPHTISWRVGNPQRIKS